jgi:ribonuclease J
MTYFAADERYLMLYRPSMLDSDFEGEFPTRTDLIFSMWPGYLDRPDWEPTKRRIAETGGEIVEALASGHIFPDDLARFVGEVGPRTVVPIHTFEPGRFCEHFENVALCADGSPYEA